MGTHLRILSERFPMNANMTGLDGFQKSLGPCALDKSGLSIGRVKVNEYDKVMVLSSNTGRMIDALL